MYSDVPWDSPTPPSPPPNSTANEEIQPCQNTEVERERNKDRERLRDNMREIEADKQIAKRDYAKKQKQERNSGDNRVKGRSMYFSVDGRDSCKSLRGGREL